MIYKKEIKDREGNVKKRLNKYGKFNIVVLSIILLGNILLSVSEDNLTKLKHIELIEKDEKIIELTEEVSELSESNFTQINEKNENIIELAIENSKLQKNALEQITGGEKFAYLSNKYWSDSGIFGYNIELVINLKGNIPLYDLNISLYEIVFVDSTDNDIGVIKEIGGNGTVSYREKLISREYFGTLHQNPTREVYKRITLTKRPFHYYRISLRARNGEVRQHLVFYKKENAGWHFATKVFKHYYNYDENDDEVRSFGRKKVLEKKTEGFPFETFTWLSF